MTIALVPRKYIAQRLGEKGGKDVYAALCPDAALITSTDRHPALLLGNRDGKDVYGIGVCQSFPSSRPLAVSVGDKDGKPVYSFACCLPTFCFGCSTFGLRPDGSPGTIETYMPGQYELFFEGLGPRDCNDCSPLNGRHVITSGEAPGGLVDGAFWMMGEVGYQTFSISVCTNPPILCRIRGGCSSGDSDDPLHVFVVFIDGIGGYYVGYEKNPGLRGCLEKLVLYRHPTLFTMDDYCQNVPNSITLLPIPSNCQQEISASWPSSEPATAAWTLTFNGKTTAEMDGSASAATVEARLFALTNIGSGNVTVSKVSGSGSAVWTVNFVGALASTHCPMMTVNILNRNEKQRIAVATGAPTVGTFTLDHDGNTTGNILVNANAVDVQAALLAAGVPTLCTGGALPNAVDVEFIETLADTDVDQMTVDNTLLVGGTYGVTTLQGGGHNMFFFVYSPRRGGLKRLD